MNFETANGSGQHFEGMPKSSGEDQRVKSVLVAFGDYESRRQVSAIVARQSEAAVLECESQESCRDVLKEQRINALLMDTALPGHCAIDFCASLREERFRPPIMLFGDCREEQTAIKALDSGATDYVETPIKPPVLMARLRAHLRQHDESDFVAYRFGPFDFEPGSRLLHDREVGRKIHLTTIETRLIRQLLHQPGALRRPRGPDGRALGLLRQQDQPCHRQSRLPGASEDRAGPQGARAPDHGGQGLPPGALGRYRIRFHRRPTPPPGHPTEYCRGWPGGEWAGAAFAQAAKSPQSYLT